MKKYLLPAATAILSATALLGLPAVSTQAASGSSLSVAVRDDSGMPVRDAVVMVYPAAGFSIGGSSFEGNGVMQQRNIQFDPGTLIVLASGKIRNETLWQRRNPLEKFSDCRNRCSGVQYP